MKLQRIIARHARAAGIAAILGLVFFPRSSAVAGEFQVAPLMLDFNKATQSGYLTVSNDGTDKLTLQMTAARWTEDAEGKDEYSPTTSGQEIVFYPKIMTLEKGEKRIIRIGIKNRVVPLEKAYRLFIEEVPVREAEKKPAKTSISIAFRIGVPLYVKPDKETSSGEVAKIELSKGKAAATITNSGNVHLKILSAHFVGKSADGKELFSKTVSGWYLLAGAARVYTTELPSDACKGLSTLNVVFETDSITVNGKLDVIKGMCQP